MNREITGKTIVITGASSGAGRAAAVELAASRPSLVLAGRNTVSLEEVAEECREFGADVLVVPTDVTDAAAMKKLAATAHDWGLGIDVWINNAGVLAAGDFDETPLEVHNQVVATNLLGYMSGVHAVLPYFKRQRHGIIINNISIGGYLPVPYGAGYTASKFGLRGFSEALKGELSPWPEIYVCDLFPHFLNTPGMLHAGNYTGKVLKPAPPVQDPVRVARSIAALIRNPRSTSYTLPSLLFKAAHSAFPELTTKITGMIIRKYFSLAEPIARTNGNLFNTVGYGMSTKGVFPAAATINKAKRKATAIGFLAGFAIGIYLLSKGSSK